MHAMMPILIDAALKAAVILVMATLLAAAMRRSSAAARHLVWTMAVVSVLGLPALAYVLPGLAVLPSGATATLGDAQPQAQAQTASLDDVPGAQRATGDAIDPPGAPAPLPGRDAATPPPRGPRTAIAPATSTPSSSSSCPSPAAACSSPPVACC